MPFDNERDFWHDMEHNKSRVYKCRVNVVKLWRKIWGPKKSEIEEKLRQIKAEQTNWKDPNSPNKDLLKNDLIERLCKELQVRDHGSIKP